MRSKNALHVFQCSVNSRRTQQVTAQRNELVSSTAVKKVRGWGPGVTATCARVVGEAIEALRPRLVTWPQELPLGRCAANRLYFFRSHGSESRVVAARTCAAA